MQQHIQLSNTEINQDLLGGVLGWPKWWIALASFLALVIATGLGASAGSLTRASA